MDLHENLSDRIFYRKRHFPKFLDQKTHWIKRYYDKQLTLVSFTFRVFQRL